MGNTMDVDFLERIQRMQLTMEEDETITIRHDIGRRLKKIIEVDCKAFNFDQPRFLRIRVEIPLDKPFQWGGPVVRSKGDEVWVAFRYECLVGWCFACGRIGHDEKECSMAGGKDMEN
nr:hypothetical protein CFP56_45026 [Quercus suber]